MGWDQKNEKCFKKHRFFLVLSWFKVKEVVFDFPRSGPDSGVTRAWGAATSTTRVRSSATTASTACASRWTACRARAPSAAAGPTPTLPYSQAASSTTFAGASCPCASVIRLSATRRVALIWGRPATRSSSSSLFSSSSHHLYSLQHHFSTSADDQI